MGLAAGRRQDAKASAIVQSALRLWSRAACESQSRESVGKHCMYVRGSHSACSQHSAGCIVLVRRTSLPVSSAGMSACIGRAALALSRVVASPQVPGSSCLRHAHRAAAVRRPCVWRRISRTARLTPAQGSADEIPASCSSYCAECALKLSAIQRLVDTPAVQPFLSAALVREAAMCVHA